MNKVFPHGSPAAVSSNLRHWVMGRDGFRCQAPGCGQTENLAVLHVDPALLGGRNCPANLVTICSVCRPWWELMGRGPFREEKHGGDQGRLAVAVGQ